MYVHPNFQPPGESTPSGIDLLLLRLPVTGRNYSSGCSLPGFLFGRNLYYGGAMSSRRRISLLVMLMMMLMLILLIKPPPSLHIILQEKAGVKRTPKGGRTKGGTTSDCRAEGARLGAAYGISHSVSKPTSRQSSPSVSPIHAPSKKVTELTCLHPRPEAKRKKKGK
ncbi:hypothetical protein BDQ94DRAFT_141084 [Aspergillus welwitschiae]|uniref:Uncharacterized protein n=1 Tax=Aspergillus welwitschiae TaxID=1341132 RepID=A0A3F3Q6U0_9EURO|nr:hypothetical protein BDQ94DRAFT_141084 [Aspergillus welwitschiae]RDH34891.1 hypothetical protein BDQ94DRAFT_141084 [Aspergillus welwitschiae]